MYGKLYSSMYSGSMVGKGSMAFAVMGYVIANMRPDKEVGCQVELNPIVLATILGEPEARVQQAIEFLCAPDVSSRSEEQEGRRLVKLGPYDYLVVNGMKYRQMRDEEERREKNRTQMATYRSSMKVAGDPELEGNFEIFWSCYPRKVAKVAARVAFARALKSVTLEKILEAVELQRGSEQWTKNDGKFIPHAATWLNQRRWDDEVSANAVTGCDLDAVLAFAKTKNIPESFAGKFWHDKLQHDAQNWQGRLLGYWGKSRDDLDDWHRNPKLNVHGPHNLANWKDNAKTLKEVIRLSNGRFYDVFGLDPKREEFETEEQFQEAHTKFAQKQAGL